MQSPNKKSLLLLFIILVLGVFLLLIFVGGSSGEEDDNTSSKNTLPTGETKQQLRDRLTEEQYHVTQEKGTETAFTGEYYNTKDKGKYYCIVCDSLLFDSSTKYDAGTGWPSFYDCEKDACKIQPEYYFFVLKKNEVVCSKCGAHLGHVFNDGPKPTGKRYCMNSAALRFRKDDNSDYGLDSLIIPSK